MTLDLFSNDENRVDLEIERTLNNTTKLFISKIRRYSEYLAKFADN